MNAIATTKIWSHTQTSEIFVYKVCKNAMQFVFAHETSWCRKNTVLKSFHEQEKFNQIIRKNLLTVELMQGMNIPMVNMPMEGPLGIELRLMAS